MISMTDPSQMPDLLAKAETLVEALPYLQRYAGETIVIKYGGHAMGDPEAQRDLLVPEHAGEHDHAAIDDREKEERRRKRARQRRRSGFGHAAR